MGRPRALRLSPPTSRHARLVLTGAPPTSEGVRPLDIGNTGKPSPTGQDLILGRVPRAARYLPDKAVPPPPDRRGASCISVCYLIVEPRWILKGLGPNRNRNYSLSWPREAKRG